MATMAASDARSRSSATAAMAAAALGLAFAAGALAGAFLSGRAGARPASAEAAAANRPKVLTARKDALAGRAPASVPAAEGRDGFVEVFEDLCTEFVRDLDAYDLGAVSGAPLRRMLQYNVPGGKLNRGLTVVQAALAVRRAQGPLSLEEEKKLVREAAVLGWCVEWLQASFLVADDLMDSSVTRRGQPCWYKNPDIGTIAVNDAIVLLTQVDILLHKYFGHDPELFLDLHRLLTETTYQTEMGQFLDLTTQPPQGPINLDLYTEERYDLIVKYKTAFYSFYAPIALGMAVAGVRDADSRKVAREICVKMGTYFQVQDDYLDCYASPEVLGKIGTDIQDSKCSWLVVQALKRASSEQRNVLLQNYGKDDEACIAKVKEIFTALELEKTYLAYEEEVHAELVRTIDRDVHTVPKEVFHGLLRKIYKRSK